MNIVIRLSEQEEARALPILLRHSPAVVLADRTYVLSLPAVESLRRAGIQFDELGTDGDAPTLAGALTGERV